MSDEALCRPDGIGPADEEGGGGRANWLSLAVLAAVMAAALLGAFGGGKPRTLAAEGPAGRLEVTTPRVLRNGLFFETHIRATARAPLSDAVIVVPASLWRNMTINTMIPAPGEEKAWQGAFRFSYGALDAGDVLDIKIDGQINPPLFRGTRGTIELHDGERRIAAIPVEITVLP